MKPHWGVQIHDCSSEFTRCGGQCLCSLLTDSGAQSWQRGSDLVCLGELVNQPGRVNNQGESSVLPAKRRVEENQPAAIPQVKTRTPSNIHFALETWVCCAKLFFRKYGWLPGPDSVVCPWDSRPLSTYQNGCFWIGREEPGLSRERSLGNKGLQRARTLAGDLQQPQREKQRLKTQK